jgi:hypothetical protein
MIGRNGSRTWALVVLPMLGIAFVAGCSSRIPPDRKVDELLKESGKMREKTYPFAGRVTIDNETPPSGGFGQPRIVVLLFPQDKLDTPAASVPQTYCDGKGEFTFTTYDTADGVPAGKYVLAFVELKYEKKKGYHGTDQLKNLYNDPEANSKVPDLVVDHQAPGKKDYLFDLKLAGREAVQPGPRAVKQVKK